MAARLMSSLILRKPMAADRKDFNVPNLCDLQKKDISDCHHFLNCKEKRNEMQRKRTT
jgi:hypothetical protein